MTYIFFEIEFSKSVVSVSPDVELDFDHPIYITKFMGLGVAL